MALQIISLIFTLITIPLLISRIKMMLLKYNALNFEHYEKLKELCGTNANDNYSALLVALNGISKVNLEPKFIEWFLYIPGAYYYIKAFSKCTDYITIDIENNRFVWREAFKNKKDRMIRRLWMFLLYVFVGSIGVIPFTVYDAIYQQIGLETTLMILSFSGLILLLAIILLMKIYSFEDASKLTKKNIMPNLDF